MSSGAANRPIGTRLVMSASVYPLRAWSRASISVFTQPGQTALTRTPHPPHSTARVRVIPIKPCLETLYASRSAMPKSPAIDATLTMLPCLRSSMPRPASRHSRNGPVRLTSSTCCQSSRVVSSAGRWKLTPALFTSTSIRPHSARTRATMETAAPSSDTSPASVKPAAPFSSSSRSVSCAGARSLRPTVYPRRPNSRAMLLPMPCAAPVTRATIVSLATASWYDRQEITGCGSAPSPILSTASGSRSSLWALGSSHAVAGGRQAAAGGAVTDHPLDLGEAVQKARIVEGGHAHDLSQLQTGQRAGDLILGRHHHLIRDAPVLEADAVAIQNLRGDESRAQRLNPHAPRPGQPVERAGKGIDVRLGRRVRHHHRRGVGHEHAV